MKEPRSKITILGKRKVPQGVTAVSSVFGTAWYLELCGITLFLFLAMPRGMWDLSSLTRDRTLIPFIGVVES